jgi:hypothetical protein
MAAPVGRTAAIRHRHLAETVQTDQRVVAALRILTGVATLLR